MKKKDYLKPEIEVMNVDVCTNLLTESPSVPETINQDLNDEVIINDPSIII